MQTAVGKDAELGSSPTLSRRKTRAMRADIVALNRVRVEQLIAAHDRPPAELILDVDACDIPLHGDQEQRQFHAYHDHYCYLPLYVYCGRALLACVLRRRRIGGARHAAAVIKLPVTRLRQAWPDVRRFVRGDSGFCRQRLIRWRERRGVGYAIGEARNARLHRVVEAREGELEQRFAGTGVKQRRIREFRYAADSWNRERRIVTRLEFGTQGTNPRFVVANLDLPAVTRYDALCCQRGEAENRFGIRASCRTFPANRLRVPLAGLACTLMQRFKEMAPAGTEPARATSATIRVKPFKIGTAVIRNTRRVRILFASHHPLRELFARARRHRQ